MLLVLELQVSAFTWMLDNRWVVGRNITEKSLNEKLRQNDKKIRKSSK